MGSTLAVRWGFAARLGSGLPLSSLEVFPMHAWTEWVGRFRRIAPYNIVAVKLARAILSQSMCVKISRAGGWILIWNFFPRSGQLCRGQQRRTRVGARASLGLAGV